MVSKYGLSRELVHFQNTLDSHLPLITSLQDHEIINDNFAELSKDFQTSLAKFLKTRKNQKNTIKLTKSNHFYSMNSLCENIIPPPHPYMPHM